MKVYLSSHGVGNAPAKLRQLAAGNRALLIDNAKDYLGTSERNTHVAEKRHEMHQLGFEAEELDLRNYFSKRYDFAREIEEFDIVFLYGGNTFVLRRALAQSGFDSILRGAVMSGKVVYGGSSAGAIVATPSLTGAAPMDDPSEVPPGYQDETIWSGLGLVPFHIVPHFGSTYDMALRAGASSMITELERCAMTYHALRDGEVYIVDGAHQELIT